MPLSSEREAAIRRLLSAHRPIATGDLIALLADLDASRATVAKLRDVLHEIDTTHDRELISRLINEGLNWRPQ